MPQWLISASRISPATSRIDFMTLRYSKPETTIKLMKRQLIEDFGHFYANAMLAARIDKEGFAIELYISEKAWVDAQNLKNRLQEGTQERGHFRTLLALSIFSSLQGAQGPWLYTPPPLQMTRDVNHFPIFGFKWNLRFP